MIATRRDLFSHLELQMKRSYRTYLLPGQADSENSQIKTYLLEFDWNGNLGAQDNLTVLSEKLSLPKTSRQKNSLVANVLQTEENGFYKIDWTKGKSTVELYVDTASDETRRFWIAYSMSPAKEVDALLDRLAAAQTPLDRIWLWPQILQTVQGWGEFRGLGLDYDHRMFDTPGALSDGADYLKMQLWGGADASHMMNVIKAQDKFAGKVVVSKIRLKYDIEDNPSNFVLEEVKFNGKLSCRGTSFAVHQNLVSRLRSLYRNAVAGIERNYILDCSEHAGCAKFNGEPLFFLLGKPIENIDQFCSVVFSGSYPFRLWGLPSGTLNDGIRISAVDLHTGSTIIFEVYSDEIGMYLHPGSCGNTVTRFFTNLQRTLGGEIKAVDNSEREIFQSLDQ